MQHYGPLPIGNPRRATMICPWCELEITEFESEYSMAQAEVIVVVLCPHCSKILGMVAHSCED